MTVMLLNAKFKGVYSAGMKKEARQGETSRAKFF